MVGIFLGWGPSAEGKSLGKGQSIRDRRVSKGCTSLHYIRFSGDSGQFWRKGDKGVLWLVMSWGKIEAMESIRPH